jgi:hypothetical protein
LKPGASAVEFVHVACAMYWLQLEEEAPDYASLLMHWEQQRNLAEAYVGEMLLDVSPHSDIR